MIEEMLAALGILVSHAMVQQWGLTFGRAIAERLRWRVPRRGAPSPTRSRNSGGRSIGTASSSMRWLTAGGTKAAKRLLRKPPKKQGRALREMGLQRTLKSSGAAKRAILPGVEHRQHKGLNDRAESSHQPPR